MWYALVDGRNSCEASTHLLWGTLEEIAESLIEEFEELIENMTEDMDEDEIEDEYGDDIAEFEEFKDRDEYTENVINSFSFSISDCSISVGCLVEGYDELVEAYDEYAKDRGILGKWQLVSEIEEEDDVLYELDSELRSLNNGFGKACEMTYFVPNDDEDDDDDEDE